MFSSMKLRTRWRISRISGVSVRSAMIPPVSARGQVSQGGEALARLALGISCRWDDVDDGRRDAVVAIGLNLVAAFRRTAEDEYIIDYPLRHQPRRLLAIACLPGLHHRRESFATAKPFVERVVERRRQVGGDDEAA